MSNLYHFSATLIPLTLIDRVIETQRYPKKAAWVAVIVPCKWHRTHSVKQDQNGFSTFCVTKAAVLIIHILLSVLWACHNQLKIVVISDNSFGILKLAIASVGQRLPRALLQRGPVIHLPLTPHVSDSSGSVLHERPLYQRHSLTALLSPKSPSCFSQSLRLSVVSPELLPILFLFFTLFPVPVFLFCFVLFFSSSLSLTALRPTTFLPLQYMLRKSLMTFLLSPAPGGGING